MILDKTAAALDTTLKAGTALTALLSTIPNVSGTVSVPAVYDTQAVDNATLPYVVFSHQAGGPENTSKHEMEQNIWYVRAYSATSAKTATEIFEQADILLHNAVLPIVGINNFWCAREENIKLLENTPSTGKVWSVGGFYRIRTSDPGYSVPSSGTVVDDITYWG